MNVFVVKMASVFMIATSTIAFYTTIALRFSVYTLAVPLLFGSYYID